MRIGYKRRHYSHQYIHAIRLVCIIHIISYVIFIITSNIDFLYLYLYLIGKFEYNPYSKYILEADYLNGSILFSEISKTIQILSKNVTSDCNLPSLILLKPSLKIQISSIANLLQYMGESAPAGEETYQFIAMFNTLFKEFDYKLNNQNTVLDITKLENLQYTLNALGMY